MHPDFLIELRAYLKGLAEHAALVKRRQAHEARRKGINQHHNGR